ncbi:MULTISPECIES: D-alanine--D-alanine ligase [Gammaproteobacteria]|uniref:D-alanine--D-alanine ligase n=1 Tax=Gammaproteobacteria TaxID=1236 RepID=UPI000DD0393B|nr:MULTISPECIES: D-alanine--D-alanine ligase [Gammaproteobacteria]RTE86316.1 D-alanine--D-alanine ligase [Aliidiomarina sp. B3213]TCZ91666.1 D-alanine--D-alanine ligase [Lysobacter sp. N42]
MSALKRVALLAGGTSAEREISLRSGRAIEAALKENNIDVVWFDPQERSLLTLANENVDAAFIALHGRGGEDGEVQAVLDYLEIPYSGSGVLACALAMDKSKTKALWQGMGLPTAQSLTVNASMLDSLDLRAVLEQLGGEVMVKPAHEGSSIGMARATNEQELEKALNAAKQFDSELLIEQWLAGPELTIGILGDSALPVIRVKTPHVFYDYQAKYEEQTTEYICPAGLSNEDEFAARELALKAFQAVGGEGWGRVDMMYDATGNLQLLEVNMVPGMTEKSLVPMAAKQLGLSFSQLVMRVLATTQPSE